MARPRLHAEEQNLGREREFNIGEIGSGEVQIEEVERSLDPALVEDERFMNEIVTVMLAETSDEKDADALVPVTVNGRSQFFARGVPQDVRRCYVERLARMKNTNYSQNLDVLDESRFNMMRARNTLRHPFTVIEDRNPRGGAWLRAVLSERN